jgi:homoserine dehydrogenase
MRVTKLQSPLPGGGKRTASPPLRVGVAGLGVVGGGAALKLNLPGEPFALCGALVRDSSKPRDEEFAEIEIFDDIEKFLSTKPDIIVDALSCGESGASLIEEALSRGVSVVSANKQALAGRLSHFHHLAHEHDCWLKYSASVGGGAPMIETVRQSRRRSPIAAITAILNGTVNFVLTAVGAGGSFEDAVKRAQEAGFAEPDPEADLSGEDARAKISILSYEAFGQEIAADRIVIEALNTENLHRKSKDGKILRQISRLREADGGPVASVLLECVDDDVFLRTIVDEGNALRIERADGEVDLCAGKGAGRRATVDSLFADLYRIKQLRAARAPQYAD